MAGHSKWKQIKHYKAATDAKRGALFTKLIREITMAAKIGGGDPSGNPRLRLAIDTARSNSMPKENIERAVKKGTGELEGVDYQEVTYEGYGPGGVALLIDAVTDNPTRTVAEVRSKMTRLGGNLGTPNSVGWMFEKKGQLSIDASTIDEDSLMEAALDAGAEDVQREDERFVVSTNPADFHAVQESLKTKNVEIAEAELAMVPKNTVQIAGKDAESLFKLIETIEELDDVQKVWANFDIDAAELAKVEGGGVIVLGIDPGTACTGYGVVTAGGDGLGIASLVECGVIRTRPRDSLAARLSEIYDGVTELLARHRPDALSVEDVFYAKNVRTTVVLGHARGVVLLAGQRASVVIHEIPPAEIKKAVVGTGAATKEQVQFMLMRLLRLKSAPQPTDAADGVAAALACLMAGRVPTLARALSRKPA